MSEKNSTLYGTDMTSGKLFPIMFRFTVPLLLANVIQQMYNLADMMIVGYQIGNAGTVGVSTGGVLISFLTGIAGAVGSAAQVCSAQLWGAGKKEKAGLVGTNLLNAVLLASLFIGVICILITSPFVTAMNCPASASLQAERYMRIVSCGLPFVFGYNVVSGIMRGMGESKKPLLFVSLAALTNVIMDGILVVVFPLEATGSAIATVISQAMSFGASILYINRSGMQEFFHIRKNRFHIQKEYIMSALKIAIPLALQYGCIQFSQIICSVWVNGFGIVESATTSIGNKIGSFIGVVTMSIDGAAGSVIAQNLGARKYGRVKRTVYTTLVMCFVICVLEYMVSMLFLEQMFSLFTRDQEVIALGRTYLRIMLITYFLNAIQGPYTSVIIGSGNVKLSFAYGILDGIVLRLGISYVLAFVFEMGVTGYWIGNALAHLGPSVIGVVYFYSGKWKGRHLVSDSMTEEAECTF